MGYTSVDDRTGAVAAAARMAARPRELGGGLATDAPLERVAPALIDQVVAESGVYEPHAAARALEQGGGDSARAVSLMRAWASTVARIGACRASLNAMRLVRRITPGIAEPTGGQYLGASLDYVQRLLDFDAPTQGTRDPGDDGDVLAAKVVPITAEAIPASLPRAAAGVEGEGLVAVNPPAVPVDLTRAALPAHASRGAFLHLLARAETGTLTALAYAGLRGEAQRQDPTLIELRAGHVGVSVAHPTSGLPVAVGEVPLTCCEILQFGAHDDRADPRFVLGVGATTGRIERRAIAAAMLDASSARSDEPTAAPRSLGQDREQLALLLDGQEAAGFVEHLKLPHHVTFASDLDVVRRAVSESGGEDPERPR